jgi:hypothetical protein
MATYGLKTYKSDGTTIILQNSTKSAVYAKTVTLDNAGTEATRSVPIPTRPAYYYYYLDFPEYTGRTIRPIQIQPGLHDWTIGVLNSVPYIMWYKNVYQTSDYGITNPTFNYTNTILYVFVK